MNWVVKDSKLEENPNEGSLWTLKKRIERKQKTKTHFSEEKEESKNPGKKIVKSERKWYPVEDKSLFQLLLQIGPLVFGLQKPYFLDLVVK